MNKPNSNQPNTNQPDISRVDTHKPNVDQAIKYKIKSVSGNSL